MPHFRWTYVGKPGEKAHVGLFHGRRTGHVLIHCNARILVIDFGVLDTKSYSFFINHELCEIRLKHKGDRLFHYTFHIDKKADTPLNRARRKQERKHWALTLLFFGGMAALITLGAWGMQRLMAQSTSGIGGSYLIEDGLRTVGRIQLDSLSGLVNAQYQFVAFNEVYNGKVNDFSRNEILLENGMPLEAGDEFEVLFDRENPKNNRILLDSPTERQITLYKERTASRHRQLHSDLFPPFVRCLVEVAFELEGIDGLADFYFQDRSPSEYEKHNRQSYLRLTRDLPYLKKVEERCWE